MRDIRFDKSDDYKIDSIGFVSVSRNEGHTVEYKDGKERYSLIYVENGVLEYSFESLKQKMNISKGNLLFVPKGLPYKTVYLKENTTIGLLLFDIPTKKPPEYLKAPVLRKSPDFQSIFNMTSYRKMNDALYLSSKIYELLYVLASSPEKVPKRLLNIMPAVDEIKHNYFENNSISYYAKLCNMSESNFRKLFREYTGASPIEYRNAIRIAEVKKMLDSGEFTVSEAAYTAGFNNMSFFYETYNRYQK